MVREKRVISMGEEPWRVHRAGAPSLDHCARSKLLSRAELEKKLKIDLAPATTIVAYHPVTLLSDTNAEAEELFAALASSLISSSFVIRMRMRAAGILSNVSELLLEKRGNGHLFVNLPAIEYWSLLRHAELLVGNSSSGIMESASFALPTVNVGMRQQGREHGKNVLHAEPHATPFWRSYGGPILFISRIAFGNGKSLRRWSGCRTDCQLS